AGADVAAVWQEVLEPVAHDFAEMTFARRQQRQRQRQWTAGERLQPVRGIAEPASAIAALPVGDVLAVHPYAQDAHGITTPMASLDGRRRAAAGRSPPPAPRTVS